jgi:hypothetical protein
MQKNRMSSKSTRSQSMKVMGLIGMVCLPLHPLQHQALQEVLDKAAMPHPNTSRKGVVYRNVDGRKEDGVCISRSVFRFCG